MTRTSKERKSTGKTGEARTKIKSNANPTQVHTAQGKSQLNIK